MRMGGRFWEWGESGYDDDDPPNEMPGDGDDKEQPTDRKQQSTIECRMATHSRTGGGELREGGQEGAAGEGDQRARRRTARAGAEG